MERIISGSVIGAAIVGVVYLGGWYFWSTMLVVSILAANEFFVMARKFGHTSRGVGMLAIFIYYLLYLRFDMTFAFPLVISLGSLLLLMADMRRSSGGGFSSYFNLGSVLAGFVYCGMSLGFLYLLREAPNGMLLVYLVFFCTWATDTGAYYVGRMWGSRKLAPSISPGKTVEGSIGGFLLSVLCAASMSFSLGAPPFAFLLIGGLVGFFGQIGDLVESMLKRQAEVKDSGTLIPGHGGILDRFDSLIVNAPIVYLTYIILWS